MNKLLPIFHFFDWMNQNKVFYWGKCENKVVDKNFKDLKIDTNKGFYCRSVFCDGTFYMIYGQKFWELSFSNPKSVKISEIILKNDQRESIKLPTQGFSMDVYGSNIYVFGGKDEEISKLIEISPKKENFKIIHLFIKLSYHSTLIYQDKLYIFGGIGEKGIENTFYYYDLKGNDWKEVKSKNDPPSARHSCSMNFYESKLFPLFVLYGGYSRDKKILNDLWTFNLEKEHWENIKFNQSPESSIPLYGHSSFIHGYSLFIYGGITQIEGQGASNLSQSIHKGKLFEYHFIENNWKRRIMGSESPFVSLFSYPAFSTNLEEEKEKEILLIGMNCIKNESFDLSKLLWGVPAEDNFIPETKASLEFYTMKVPCNKERFQERKSFSRILKQIDKRIYKIENNNFKIIKIYSDDHFSIYNNEKKILEKLDHPNAIKEYSKYLDGTSKYELHLEKMDYSLNLIKKGLTNEQKFSIIYQLIKGMKYIHKNNIIHCDLKLENILYKERKEGEYIIKICDFGSALELEPSEVEKILESPNGTINYFPPEMDEKKVSKKSDIWSFGFILYYVMTEKVLNENISKSKQKLSEEILKDNSIIDMKNKDLSFLIHILVSCFQFDPQKRPTFKELYKILKEKKVNFKDK